MSPQNSGGADAPGKTEKLAVYLEKVLADEDYKFKVTLKGNNIEVALPKARDTRDERDIEEKLNNALRSVDLEKDLKFTLPRAKAEPSNLMVSLNDLELILPPALLAQAKEKAVSVPPPRVAAPTRG